MSRFRFFCGRIVLCLGLIAIAGARISAQQIPVSEAEFKEMKRLSDNNQRMFTDFYEGKVVFDPKNKSQMDAVQAIARYQVFSFAYPPSQANKIDAGPDMMRRFKDAEDYMKAILRNDRNQKNTQALVDAYFTAIINNAATVAKSDVPVCRFNAVKLLGSVGNILSSRDDATFKPIVEPQGIIKIGDLLLDRLTPILEKAPDDATRLAAVVGIRETLKASQLLRELQPTPKSLTQTKEAAALKLVAQIITSPPSAISSAVKGGPEIEGYKYMRSKAIGALANGSSPMLPGDFCTIKILASCLVDNALTPEARTDELAEAAAGIARLAPLNRRDTDFVPEYAVYWMGRFLQNYSRIYTEAFKAQYPWKSQAARLSESLTYFRQRYKNNKQVQEMMEIYLDFLAGVEKGPNEPKPLPNIEEKLANMLRDPSFKKQFFNSKPDTAIVEKAPG